ncbi:MAG: hypothetical protein A2Y62_02025 [Candidatus Fischerbacteria bacterium RBG_13_37_8]|uniref:Fibronectin type-III domain-containing protein n=1 Tax=Candidatus Fischerbacteria bacterium RBG_13_37_8 TaxID=1817863 RepID=A0A1F5VKA7_9BACT|nr:MAG: hypothetical protein A2Y62_02025 [Candidatus Fischerbacteria bacterium RBG_13_37_8]
MKIYGKGIVLLVLVLLMVLAVTTMTYAFRAKNAKNDIERLEFMEENLYISLTNTPIADVLAQLANRAEWEHFLSNNKNSHVYIDVRSGRPTSIIVVKPIIPGSGDMNTLTMQDISMKLGYEVRQIGSNEVRQLIRDFIRENANLLGINPAEIGDVNAVNTDGDYIWDIYVNRKVNGIPVRDANMVFVINHGNLVLYGVEKWGTIDVNIVPAISKEQAIANGFAMIGGLTENDTFLKEGHLELVPYSPTSYTAVLGTGYGYHLVWAYTFTRDGYHPTWEMLVDAHSGKVLSFQDLNQYALRKIVGMAYPLSNDNCSPQGIAYKSPMSYTDTGFAAPNNYTSINGLYDWTSGTATTTLSGRYVDITDNCGAISEASATGDIDMLGANGDHDCTYPSGHSAGDTSSSRSAASEVPQINRMAASWVNYSWLTTSLVCNVNIVSTCNAYWNGTINFFRSGGGCGNTGEIAAVFDHEWAHGIDDNDPNGTISQPGEVPADVQANQRLHTSCTGEGFWLTYATGCSPWQCPSSGVVSGNNCSGYGDCCLDCTGIRDADYAKHASGIPHTPVNFVCALCGSGGGTPCGKETHCENAPGAEAQWDLVARDLQAAPFNFDKQTAFEFGNKMIFQGSADVIAWYTCSCASSTSDGCGATNGYMQFITKEDDDGNINNGTPHMTAIYNAWNRHAIACATPTVQNSGCSTGPTGAPVLTATPVSNGAQLSWTAVPNAANYYVMKSIGPLGCDLGKIKIATVSGTTYTDQALDCYGSHYAIWPVGSNTACLGKTSNCVSIVAPVGAPTNVTATGTAANQVTVSWTAVTGATGYNVYRKYTLCGVVNETQIAGPITTTSYVDNGVAGGVTYQYSVSAISTQCGEHAKSGWVSVVPTGDCTLSPCFAGATSVVDNKTASCALTVNWSSGGTSSCGGYPTLKYNIYKSTDPVFVPGPSNLLVNCQTGTSYLDTNVTYGTTYYYVVRAEDSRTGGAGPCNGGNTESNMVKRSGTPTGIPQIGTLTFPFETGLDGWTIEGGTWTLSTARYNPGGSTASVHSSQALNLQCDYLVSPVITPSASTTLTLANWYDIEIFSGGYWYDRCNVWAVQGATHTLLTPASGKAYSTGTYYNWGYCSMGTNPGWCGAGTAQAWGDSVFDLSTYNGQDIQIEIRYMTDDLTAGEGVYVDDISLTGVLAPTSCTTGTQPPGKVLNNLTVAKSGANLNLAWTAPGGTCVPTGYGLYRGALPFTVYNHASLNCAITGTSTSTAQDTGSYYYLVVPLNASNEGSYGVDSSNVERPQGTTPCHAQDLTSCN